MEEDAWFLAMLCAFASLCPIRTYEVMTKEYVNICLQTEILLDSGSSPVGASEKQQ